MQLSKVLLFHKRSTYQLQALEFRDKRFIELLEQKHEAVNRVQRAHQEHTDSLDKIMAQLKARNIKVDTKTRSTLNHKIQDIDLLISVGGDGTFLDASHYLDTVPILGVNSARSSSFGHFCLANDENIASVLDQITQAKISPVELIRLELILNGKVLPQYALNEVLIAHQNPAGTSRYIICINNEQEEQISSGIWMGTPAGSTGAVKAAGGSILPVDSRQFQYIGREVYVRPGQQKHLVKGILNENSQIKVISQMRTGAIYIDGQHLEYPFKLGDDLIVKVSPMNLRAFIDRNLNDRFSNK